MATATGDRNLLFGVLALQMDFIGRDALVQAMHAWVLDKTKPLGQILVEQKALGDEPRAVLDAVVQQHLKQHGDDAEKSLASVSSVGSVRDELQRIADPDVQASLAHVRLPADPNSTGPYSVGAPSVVGRRFRVLRPHAEGGLGKVSVARDEELHREVALKEIKEYHADHPESRARFLVEAEITGGLEHPGIVPVYGLGAYEDGRPFYAMRFIKGNSLKEAIARFHETKSPLSAGPRMLELRQLLGRFNAVCNAIAYAHSRGVLHRDLKPSNVMLGKYGETLVVDWGLAKPVGRPDAAGDGDEATLRPASAGDSAPTQMGQAVGTPPYMSPEQAAGRLNQLSPASDVYGLGATLYCVLTGKPPFEKGDLGGVLQRVQRGDFPRPRQVRRNVPRALEAICLKAMALRPEHRYATPKALAADVEKWLADEPTTAYREPWRVRLGRWVRRRQALAAGLAAGLLVAVVAGTVGVWQLDRLRTEQRRDVESSLTEVVRLQGEAHWAEARAVLAQARVRLGAGGPADLKTRLERMQGELELVQTLDAIRLKRATFVEGRFDFAGADREYADVFRAAGMAEVGGDAAAAAAWAAGSGVRKAVVAALDDWAACTAEAGRRAWILETVRRVDPDPWRDRARDPAVWKDAAALARLAGEEQAAKQSPQLLAALGAKLTALGEDAAPMLRAAQERSPGDFWINFDLGDALNIGKKAEEAVGYYRAALALRPGTAAVYNNLGVVLSEQGKREEAAAEYRTAIDLDPKYAAPHFGLGFVLADQGNREEATAEYRTAIALDPKLAAPHHGLGEVFSDQGKWEEAAAEFRTAIALDPTLAQPHNGLGNVLADRGKPEEAAAEYRTAIALDPKLAEPHDNLGKVLADQGKAEEAAAEYRTAIALDPKYAKPHNNLGNVLRDQGKREEAAAEYRSAIALDPKHAVPHSNLGLVLSDQGKGEEAAAEYRTAIALDPKYALPHYALGNVLRDQGKREAAAAEFRTAINLDPKYAEAHGNLGILLLQQGHFTEAKEELQRCLELFRADDPRRKVASAQLQRCERMLDLDKKLSAVLKGDAQPADAAERMGLADVCTIKKYYAAAARFYTDAFAAQAALADPLQTVHRYNAACVASLAAAGQGEDADKLDDQDRARLRHQALGWLRDDLAVWSKQTDNGPPKARAAVQQTLQHWKEDSDLASVRDPAALDKLPDAECADWKKLWADVDALLKKTSDGGQK